MRRLSVLITLLVGNSPFAGAATQLPSPPPDSSRGNQVHTLLAQANDVALNQYDSRRALALYSEALSLTGANAEILWQISRAYIDIGEQLPAGTDEEQEAQLSMFEKALEFAEKSATIDPGNSMALTFRAIAGARVTLYKGLWESVGLMNRVREDLEQALHLDSTNHLAHYALAATHMKVIEKPWIIRWPLGLGWGDRDEAIAHFESAIALRWDLIGYRLACAQAYIEEGEYESARAHLMLAPMLRPQNRGDEGARKEAFATLDRIRDEE
ncbi:MAG: tetratricopeptide repeat protein [Bacteroidota bacterium]